MIERDSIRDETRGENLFLSKVKEARKEKVCGISKGNLETFFPFSIPNRGKEKGETRSRNDVVGGLFNFASRQVARSR